MKFFLHVQNGTEVVLDVEGEDFKTLQEAKIEAAAAARDLMADAMRAGQSIEINRSIEIANEFGVIVATVAFHDAIVW